MVGFYPILSSRPPTLRTSSGQDDAYGFMELSQRCCSLPQDMSISLDQIEITAISHGGTRGKYIERSRP